MSSVRLRAFFSIFILFLVQNSLHYLFPAKAPSLVLIGVLFYALSEGSSFGAMIGLWGGFLLDLFSQGRPGFFMAALAGAGIFSGSIASKIFKDSLFARAVLPLLLLYGVTLAETWVLRRHAGEPAGIGTLVEAFLPWPLAATAFCSPWIFDRLKAFSPHARRRVPSRY